MSGVAVIISVALAFFVIGVTAGSALMKRQLVRKIQTAGDTEDKP